METDPVTTPLHINPKLSAALSKAQGDIKFALKSAENPAFKKDGKSSTYAKIEDVIEVIQSVAMANGLYVRFNFKSIANEKTVDDWIQYILGHSSGEREIGDWVFMRLRGVTQHDFGAANTYYRRQLLKAIYQIPEEDDDGNYSSGKAHAPPDKPKKPINYAPPGNIPDELDQALESFPDYEHPPMPPKNLTELYDLVEAHKIKPPEVLKIIKLVAGAGKKSTDLNEGEITKVIERLMRIVGVKE